MTILIALLVCLQVKHFAADYLLQSVWMIRGKGSLFHPGGYVHALIHAALSAALLQMFGLDAAWIAAIFVGELALHYAIDFTKAHINDGGAGGPRPRYFWAMHGADQLAHHLTYAAILWLFAAAP